MKKLICAMLIAACLPFYACNDAPAESTAQQTEGVTEAATEAAPETEEEPVMYYLTSPYNKKSHRVGEPYESLEEAKKDAKENERFGYVVYDSEGQLVYNPTTSLKAAEIVYEAKLVADYIRDNKYSYGHADINPPLAAGKEDCDKLCSCDRLVGWSLFNAGYTDQPRKHGLTSDLIPFMKRHGFTEITDMDELMPGDVVFVGYAGQPAPYGHVFLYAGKANRRNHYRYDAGSVDRIRCAGSYGSYFESGQPFCEPLELSSNALFMIAYRPPVEG